MILFGQQLSKNNYPLIVAELSCNHEGSLAQAKELIKAAKEATADAVKIQVYTADDMTYPYGINKTEPGKFIKEKCDFIVKEGPWKNHHLYYLYEKTQTPYEWVPELFAYAKEINIPIFASVFSLKGLSLLEELNCPAYKIASFELPDLALIRKVAKTNKPVILSTGMASTDDIDQAMQCVNPRNVVLMHCVSAYPGKDNEQNLWKITQLDKYYGCPIGYSDHTNGVLAAQLSIAMGARVIEKHMVLSASSHSEDSSFSLSPTEFRSFAKYCRAAAEATFVKEVPGEESSKQFRRSLYVVKDIAKGESFTLSNVRTIRPSYGLSPSMLSNVLVSRATCDLKAGTALKREHLI